MKQTFILPVGRAGAIKAINEAPDGYVVSLEEETRDLNDNAKQWPILQDFANQLSWPVNGSMTKLTAEEWKDILTSAFHQETVRLAQGLNGGVVMLGLRTRKFKKKDWPEWMAFLKAVASERGVKLSAPKYLEEVQ